MSSTTIGISGFSLHVPPYRVQLKDWCAWTGQPWDKIETVVGHSFRMLGPDQSVYTMAANAVLRLIERCDIDPRNVGFLGLGTESSTDNSAGAIIVKGMVDSALQALGKPRLSRSCEVPEFKHACLGGIYALKGALRYVGTDGAGRQAIVVCTDQAVYERGSSGEPTQGAGAVAMLVEENPSIAAIDLKSSGNAADYRGIDFRKPLAWRNASGVQRSTRETPVFNGRYSTNCYVDEMLHALYHMLGKRELDAVDYLRQIEAVFMHRPFRRMPENGWGMAWLFALTQSADHRDELVAYCAAADIEVNALLEELSTVRDITEFADENRIRDEVYPLTNAVLRAFRSSDDFLTHVRGKMALGSDLMMELGNLYTGSLPAWLAAGLEQAAANGIDLAGKEVLMLGYGSGDAAETIPMVMQPGWEQAAAASDVSGALEGAVDLNEQQYIDLHEGRAANAPDYTPNNEFLVDRTGSRSEPGFEDIGVEYYRYVR